MPDIDLVALKEHADAHARAVLAQDGEALTADFAEQARPLMRLLGTALPRPVLAAEVTDVSQGTDGGLARIRYTGQDDVVDVLSTWALHDGRLRIVDAQPVGPAA